MMIRNYNESVETNHKPNQPYILDHPYRILIFTIIAQDQTKLLRY